MLESQFIKQNKDKWKTLESQVISGNTTEPEQLADHFIHITEDLSYARTHYPNRKVRLYLNDLARSVFQLIYKNRTTKWKLFTDFWQYELPSIVYASRKEFLIAFLIFGLAMTIGVLSSQHDPKFARVILGDGYIDMTDSNIKNNDPMAVYKQSKEITMFLGITLNNLRVAFMTFILGAFMSLGTIMFLFSNGIMVGTFQHYFVTKGLFRESFLAIWLHGTLEISSIIIAGAAGIVLGSGLLFPGTYSRFQSFKLSTRKGLKIMLGTVPIFITAALVEGFLTRHTEIPDYVRGIFIFLSLVFIIGYFVYYPWVISKKPQFHRYMKHERFEVYTAVTINNYGIRNFGDSIGLAMDFIDRHFGKLMTIFAIFSLICGSVWVGAVRLWGSEEVRYTSFDNIFQNIIKLFSYEENILLLPLVTLTMTGLFIGIAYMYKPTSKSFMQWFAVACQLFIIFLLQNIILLADTSTGLTILYIVALPFMALWASIIIYTGSDIFNALVKAFQYTFSDWGMSSGLNFISILLSLFLIILFSSPLMMLYQDLIEWNITSAGEAPSLVTGTLFAAIAVFILLCCFAFSFLISNLLFDNLHEISKGEVLKKKIEELKLSKM